MTVDINLVSMVLAVVSLIITVIGFFASLKFYQDGVSLQRSANDALAKIEERAGSIQNQVGGMFEKTLDAAIAAKVPIEQNFATLQHQLEETKRIIVGQALAEIGEASKIERERLASAIEERLGLVQDQVEITREAAESLIGVSVPAGNVLTAAEFGALKVLATRAAWLTAGEVAAASSLSSAAVRRSLRSLEARGLVSVQLSVFDGYVDENDHSGNLYGATQKARYLLLRDGRWSAVPRP